MVKRIKELASPLMAWYFTALLWFVHVVVTGYLLAFRCVKTSGIAQLIDFGNVPLLHFTDTHYKVFFCVGGVAGFASVLAAPIFFRRKVRRARSGLWQLLACFAVVGLAAWVSRYTNLEPAEAAQAAAPAPIDGSALSWASRFFSLGPAEAVQVQAPGLLDGLLVLLTAVASLLFLPTLSVLEGGAPRAEDGAEERSEGGGAGNLAAVYLLSSASLLVCSLQDHLAFWDPATNGGSHYESFFKPGELGYANLVLYSTSFLFASLGGLAACAGFLVFRLLSRGGQDAHQARVARDCRRQALAGSLVWTAALMGPWLFKIFPEIRAEGAWILPLAVWGLTFAALVPLYFIGGLLLRRDFEGAAPAQAGGDGAGAFGFRPQPQESAFLTFLLFPVYPWLRLLRPGHARVYFAGQMLLAAAAVGLLTWLVHDFERLYDFDDWRGMIKAGQLPFLRAFFSLGAAGFLYLCGQRAVGWWTARGLLAAAPLEPADGQALSEAPLAEKGVAPCGDFSAPGSFEKPSSFPASGSLENPSPLPASRSFENASPFPASRSFENASPFPASGSLENSSPLPARGEGPGVGWPGQARGIPQTPAQAVRPRRTPVVFAWARRALIGLALACLAAASWPFWGWSHVPLNVFARTHEFSSRHKFELGFLHWLFDFDRDGYASLLHGSDSNDWNASLRGGGLRKPKKVAVPVDRFEVDAPAAAQNFPNVVLLFLEGVTPKAISAYGQRKLDGGAPSTPHLDALAAAGTRFTRARCCYPSTWDGWFAVHAGRFLRVMEMDASRPFGDCYARHNSLHQVLKLAGVKRWCHPNIRPFCDLFVPREDHADDWEHEFDSALSAEDERKEIWRGDKRNERMLRFIDSLKPGERFFLSEHMSDTHFPWVRTSDAHAQELGFPNGLGFVEKDALLAGKPWDKQARYYQTVTRMDAQVGVLVERLKARGLFERTLFIVIGDHGCQWYEHEHGYYVSHLYEQSLQLPVLVKAPGLPGGMVCDAEVLQMDILPTVMELAGVRLVPTPGQQPLAGHSLVPFLRGKKDERLCEVCRDRDLLLTTHYDTVGVLAGFRYKLIFDRPAGTYLLFDLASDPEEMQNLADERPELLAAMQERFRELARKQRAFLGGIRP